MQVGSATTGTTAHLRMYVVDHSPMDSERYLDVVLALDPLSDLPRTGWLLRGISPAESIAAHSHGVGVVSMLVV